MTPTSKHSAISSRSRTLKAKNKSMSRIDMLADSVGNMVDEVSNHLSEMRKSE